MRLTPVLGALALTGSLLTLGSLSTPAQAAYATPSAVAVPGAVDVVTDPGSQRVFVATGGTDTVEVFDWAGNSVGTVTNIDNVFWLADDPGAGIVYASQSGNDKIAAIDAATLEVTRYSASATGCPGSLAVVDSVVFYGYSGSGCNSSGGIGVLDPSEPSPEGRTAATDVSYHPLVVASPGLLVAIEAGLSPSTALSYRISGTDLQRLNSRWDIGSNTQDLAMSPDGSEVVVASGSPYEHRALDPVTLQTVITYPSSYYPNAAAVSPDGTLVAAGTNSHYDPDVRLYHRDDTTLVTSWEFGDLSPAVDLLPGGLAFGGSSRLFALGQADSGARYLLTMDLTDKLPSLIDLQSGVGFKVGEPLTITGTLEAGTADLLGQKIFISRTSHGVNTNLGQVEMDAAGKFSFTDTPTRRGVVYYVARWAGNAEYDAAETSHVLRIKRTATKMTIALDNTQYRHGDRAEVTVTIDHLDTAPDKVTVTRWGVGGSRKVVAQGAFDSEGSFVTQVPVKENGYFSADYSGNAAYRVGRVQSDDYFVKARTPTDVDGFFRRDGMEWFVRPSVTPVVYWTIHPHPIGGCGRVVVQKRIDGEWRTLHRTSCQDTGSASYWQHQLDDPRRDGTHLRVRLSARANDYHLPVLTRWAYITFVRIQPAVPAAKRVQRR